MQIKNFQCVHLTSWYFANRVDHIFSFVQKFWLRHGNMIDLEERSNAGPRRVGAWREFRPSTQFMCAQPSWKVHSCFQLKTVRGDKVIQRIDLILHIFDVFTHVPE
jgi:hypothetical protein